MQKFAILLVFKILTQAQGFSKSEKVVSNLGDCNVEFNDSCSTGRIVFYVYSKDLLKYSDPHGLSTLTQPVVLKSFSEPVNSSGLLASDPKLFQHFNNSKETKILIHGYLGHIDSRDLALLRQVYIQENNFNLVVVDWGQLAKLPCYATAVFSTRQAGKCTAVFLENFVSDKNFKRVHVIGFSLGAHAAAFASNQLKQKLNKQLGRITGLDPALPFFASLENTMKLDKEDADFVDLIHTNSGVFGKIEPTGHVDFYVNGGFSQPACINSSNIPLCSHLMATNYYAESVLNENKGFWGVPCATYFHYLIGWCDKNLRVQMGERCDHRSRGVYFVQTRSKPPYALG